jgi:hypothetical protein
MQSPLLAPPPREAGDAPSRALARAGAAPLHIQSAWAGGLAGTLGALHDVAAAAGGAAAAPLAGGGGGDGGDEDALLVLTSTIRRELAAAGYRRSVAAAPTPAAAPPQPPLASSHAGAIGGAAQPRCCECEAAAAAGKCVQCGGDAFCRACFDALHARGSRRGHQLVQTGTPHIVQPPPHAPMPPPSAPRAVVESVAAAGVSPLAGAPATTAAAASSRLLRRLSVAENRLRLRDVDAEALLAGVMSDGAVSPSRPREGGQPAEEGDDGRGGGDVSREEAGVGGAGGGARAVATAAAPPASGAATAHRATPRGLQQLQQRIGISAPSWAMGDEL